MTAHGGVIPGGPARRGGAYAPYEYFPVGKISAQGKFTFPEH